MNISRYKAGTLKKQYGCSSFSPELINHEWIPDDAKINHLLSEADRKLGELNAFSMLIPDVDFFIKMHIAKEATTARIFWRRSAQACCRTPGIIKAKRHSTHWIKKGIYLLKDVAFHYKNSSLEKRQQIVGVIFSEKIVFDGNNYRTMTPHPLFQVITTTEAAFQGNKNRKGQKNSDLSCWVEVGCTKSNFIQGLKMIEDYMHVGRY